MTSKIEQLCRAAMVGNTADVVRLVEEGVDVNGVNRRGRTPLHWACRHGHTDTVNVLLAHQADVNAISTRDGSTPLFLACVNNHTDIVNALLAHQADVNAGTNTEDTPLHRACVHGYTDIVNALLAHQADVNAIDTYDGYAPLHSACVDGDTDIVNVLLAYQADVNARCTNKGYTALHHACGGGHTDLVNALLAHQADVNAINTNTGVTPLHRACVRGLTDIVNVLLAHQADVNAISTRYKQTPLHLACEEYDPSDQKRISTCVLLIEAGGDTNIVDEHGKTPIDLLKPKYGIDTPNARPLIKAIELRESSGQALLLLAESEKETLSWHEAIQGAIKALGPAQNRYQPSPEDEEFMFTHSGQGSSAQVSKKSGENIRDSVNRNLMGGERKPFISRQLRPKSVLLMTGRYDKPNGDFVAIKERNKIKNKLKSFITRRPTIEALQKQGIMREENVFGKQLAHLCEREGTVVPRFVTQCIEAIDKRGLKVDGIYRVSGNLSLIQKLRFQIDQEKPVDFDVSPYKEDIHVITGSLKLYFRELPEPLLTYASYDRLMAAIRIPDKTIKQNIFKEILRLLPKDNFETLKYLVEHLSRIVANCKHNRMAAQSVAIVFGPTLMWSKKEAFNIAMNMVQQNQCIEFILNEHASIL